MARLPVNEHKRDCWQMQVTGLSGKLCSTKRREGAERVSVCAVVVEKWREKRADETWGPRNVKVDELTEPRFKPMAFLQDRQPVASAAGLGE